MSEIVAAASALSFPSDAPVNDYPLPSRMPYDLTLREFLDMPGSSSLFKRREQIYRLQSEIFDFGSATKMDVTSGPQPVHLFTKGIYTRQLTMPAGLVIVSKRHAREHIVFISKGSATVFTEDGVTLVVAPYMFVSPAGAKRALCVHEETTWTTIHRTDATSLDEVERDLMMDEPESLWHTTLQLEQEQQGSIK